MDLKKIVPTPDGLEQTEGLAELRLKWFGGERSEGVRGALVGLAQWAQENEGKGHSTVVGLNSMRWSKHGRLRWHA